MLERKMYSTLVEWKNHHDKCLVVKGQRQVGKSYIIEYFGQSEYEDMVKLDFSQDSSLSTIFKDKRVDSMINAISLYARRRIVPGSTLIFLDEIQESPDAYSSLKQFSLDGRYDVIASGSLLGVERKGRGRRTEPDPLIPLGYEKEVTMHGLDFEEFLWAMKVDKEITKQLRRCIHEGTPIPEFVLKTVNDLFREYMIVGGMPEAVQKYADSGVIADAQEVLDDILTAYTRDITRYNTGADIVRTAECFESIPRQLSQNNKKFMYSRISDGTGRKSAGVYTENLLWIEHAGYGNFCRYLTRPEPFLKNNSKSDVFKVYLSDTGMLLRMSSARLSDELFKGDLSINMGAFGENVVAECFVKAGFPIYTYSKRNNPGMIEIDFVLELANGITAFEVKTGKHRDAPSLNKLKSMFPEVRRVILENGNISTDADGVWHYPLFSAAFVDEMEKRK